MSQNSDSGQGPVNGGQKPSISAGRLLPFFKQRGSPSVLEVSAANRLVTLLRSIQNLQVHVVPAIQGVDGVALNEARVDWSETNLAITLMLANGDGTGGGGSGAASEILAGRVTGESADYVTVQPVQYTGNATYSDTGTPINVAKPFELRGLTGLSIQPIYYNATTPQIIWAVKDPTGGSGVYQGGADVGYLDVNSAARQWCAVQGFTIVSIQGDYITATNNITSASTLIAKPNKLRNSITAQTIDGVAYTYSYTSTVQRTASTSGYSEYQRVVERYLVGDIIYADRPSSTGVTVAGVPLVWMDTNRDGREWAARADQSAP